MSHLGEEISALVDGQLPLEETEAALEHVVACDECAARLAAERAFRRRLAEARDVRPSENLTERLVRMGAQPAPPEPRGVRAVVERAREPFTHVTTRRRLAIRGSMLLGSAACALGLVMILGAAYQRTGDPLALLDEASDPSQQPLQVMATAAPAGTQQEPAGAARERSTSIALDWLQQHGWPAPDRVPPYATINLLGTLESDGEEVVVLEFDRFGRTATVIEQRGTLDLESLGSLEEIELGGNGAHLIPGPGATVVLECEGTAVLVTSVDDPDLVHAIAAAMPVSESGGGVAERLDQGWETLVGWTDVLLQTR